MQPQQHDSVKRATDERESKRGGKTHPFRQFVQDLYREEYIYIFFTIK